MRRAVHVDAHRRRAEAHPPARAARDRARHASSRDSAGRSRAVERPAAARLASCGVARRPNRWGRADRRRCRHVGRRTDRAVRRSARYPRTAPPRGGAYLVACAARPAAMTRTLTLYSRPGCHLCEHVETELYELLQGRRDVAVRIVDITDDPVLEREYLIRIPVLTDGATELSEYPLDRARVERWLDGR